MSHEVPCLSVNAERQRRFWPGRPAPIGSDRHPLAGAIPGRDLETLGEAARRRRLGQAPAPRAQSAGARRGAPPGRHAAAGGAGPGFLEAATPPRARARAPRRPAHARGREGARPGGGGGGGARSSGRRAAEGRLAERAVAAAAPATIAGTEWGAREGAEGGEAERSESRISNSQLRAPSL